jgi:uncharacterized protein (TIGR00725 family)
LRRFVVGVMGSGEEADEETLAHARELGRLIAAEGWVVLSGGRDAGVMRAVNAGAKQVPGSLTVGILPNARARPSPDVDVVIVTDLGNARNNVNVLSSDVVVACGRGGAGTVSEIALALKDGKTVILMSADPMTNAFFQELEREKIVVVQKPEEAIAVIKRLRR